MHRRVTVDGCLVQFFHIVTNWPKETTNHLSAAKDSIKMYFFVKQPIRKTTEFALKLLMQLSTILFAFASAQVYFNHVTLWWCFSCKLYHCVTIVHVD